MPDLKQPSVRNLQRALSTMSTERLMQMRKDLEDEVAENVHYNSTSEVGRTESNEQEAEIHDKLYVIFTILRRRGVLTKAEVDQWFATLPVTRLRVYTKPRGWF